MVTLQDLQIRAEEVRKKYDDLNARDGQAKWDGSDYAAGLVGDIGDLVKIIMAKEGKRRGDDIDAKLKHELGDIMWSLLVIATNYDINLEESFEQTMNELDQRLAA